MISVTHNSAQVISGLGFYAKQARFAMALALTRTATDIKDAMPAALESDLDRPTQFTKRGFAVDRATPAALRSAVYVRPLQSAYLRYQVLGGPRSPKRTALRLPTTLKLNQYGNMPAGMIKQLIKRADAGKRATGRQAKRFGISKGLDLFYGDPGDGRPAGIYQRLVLGPDRHRLVPVVVFPKQPAQYRRRFDFYGHALRVAQQRWPSNVSAALRQALSSAR